MKKINVILSGGSGSRLWPLSRKSRTKQYIPLFEGKSLFDITIVNNQAICDAILVVGNIDNYELSLQSLKEMGETNYQIVVEAMPKNTAAAIAFAALSVEADDLLLVTPSDHIIENKEGYQAAVQKAFEWAAKGHLVTFGIQPSKPETGYGYIQSNGDDVVAFHEKPSKEKAQDFINQANYHWNSGIFCFQAKTYLEELNSFRPDILEACKQVMNVKNSDFLEATASAKIPSESIDYAVMEKSDKMKVVKGTFEWSDLGSYEALFDYFSTKGAYVKDSNLIIAETAHVELHGLENMMVVQSGEAILVMPLSMSQEVKRIYERLLMEGNSLVE
ncbi:MULTISPECIES: mannose-1-phosphate guanylyltransferase [unclassified Flavobacterium]|uniref:mannose-1-phosphate guanylyltransferase n=1 Tax=unclassified Flavobacterium TaxID=196869 RepID=UPI00129293C1|nr:MULTISPECIES: mannose-1-phosphate guanylyltransferase [unclassified Flavobacterium]MQP52053.1 NTP transferase domain-containing protein [Flavobacterium sp. LMO9]MQP61922.1 NTP transferase domain-containing protein [Flavobacterium sp. LMO6]